MGAAFFYHLSTQSLEQTLPMLLGKSLEQGWRIEVRGRDKGRLEGLDTALWLRPEDSFLPHGLAGGEHDTEQPILLTLGDGAANAPSCVISVDGADISAEEVQAMARVCILFDGHDSEAVQHARRQWKALSDAGCAAQYWSQEGGRWEKKAETST